MQKINRRQFLNHLGNGSVGLLAGTSLVSSIRFNCTPRTKHRPPNILFAISDDQSWLHTGAYGCEAVKTPAFDRVAQEGVLFNHAFGVAPQCSPNRASILTGRYIWQLEEAGTHASNFPQKFQVFPDLLEAAGYQVGLTRKGWSPGNWEITGWKRNPAGESFNRHEYEANPAEGIAPTNYARNFQEFVEQRDRNRPFCFWYGCSEPHRSYEKGIGLKRGKKLESVIVPPFLPDTPEVRSDLLDYFVEIEWFDQHLGQMLALLEQEGEAENTMVVVTSDNGMPFPRAKANLYEYGTHAPLAIRWPAKVPGGRTVDDLISFVDYAPTFLEAAGLTPPAQTTGQSFLNILTSDDSGQVDPQRKYVLTGRERHTHARPDNLGYPARAIRTREYLFIWNVKPDRWPVGDPTGSGDPEGYHDIDGSPTKTFMLEHHQQFPELFRLAFEKRPEEELYAIQEDPGCLKNLAGLPEFAEIKDKLKSELHERLTEQGDPRRHGRGDIFESYPRYSRMRQFPGFKQQGEYNPEYQ